jgi:hypothetical protein
VKSSAANGISIAMISNNSYCKTSVRYGDFKLVITGIFSLTSIKIFLKEFTTSLLGYALSHFLYVLKNFSHSISIFFMSMAYTDSYFHRLAYF